ncbi:hypothetical protein JKF63_03957 [Porcisia hertigi]|uniref:Uncharacterized protein n=1 Tax=Porcisia hertigi TaxID=2761500 RepID=A0A836L3T6_9TRYP|nr:hypothetical protein JKF63_03957 [Porcisia hertigi]
MPVTPKTTHVPREASVSSRCPDDPKDLALSQKDSVERPAVLREYIQPGVHPCTHIPPPKDPAYSLPSTQPSFNRDAKGGGSPNDMYEPNSLYSSHQRIGGSSSLGTSASTGTAPPCSSDSTTTLHWVHFTEDRFVPCIGLPKAVPVNLRRAPEFVFERFVEPRVQRTAEEESAMLAAAAFF